MGKIIAICDHKGGVGKTTTCINLGAALAAQGKRVLLIDLDAQRNLTLSLHLTGDSIYNSFMHGAKLNQQQVTGRLYAVASSLDLAGAEIELTKEKDREYRLRGLLQPLKHQYDYILIDCAPSLSLLTINALTASDYALIPLTAEYLAVAGITTLTDIIEQVRKSYNKGLQLGGVLLTRYDKRKTLNREVLHTIRQQFGSKLFNRFIRENITIAEAPAAAEDIFRYAPTSAGAEDYRAAAHELAKRFK
jgi:chromosome partitioning protein